MLFDLLFLLGLTLIAEDLLITRVIQVLARTEDHGYTTMLLV